MNKKILIIFITLILLLAVIPIIGNQFIEDTLSSKIQNLKSNGLGVKNSTTDSSYLDTKKHYEFFVEDMDKFITYLNRYSDEQLPPYIDAVIDGVLVGADLEYSNFPFAKALSIDIYPLSLSKLMKEEIEKEDAAFSERIASFLQSKGVLYHLNYDIVSEKFDGFIKDIDEKHTLKDSTKLHLKLQNARYSGRGELIAPTLLISHIATISLNAQKSSERLNIELNNFTSNSDFKSHSSYMSDFGLQNMKISAVTEKNEKIVLSATDIKANLSLRTEGKFTQFFAKNSLENLQISSNEVNFKASSLNYDAMLSDMDKDSFEALRIMVSKIKHGSSANLEEEMKKSLVALLSKGLKLNINDFSLNDIVLNDTQKLDSASLQATLVLKEDKNLAKKVDYALFLVASSIDTDIKLKLSKKIFTLLEESIPMAKMLKSYAKEDGKDLIYEISFRDGKFKINGKALQN